MNTVLFPTDFSANSLHAIRYGLNLFKDSNVDYILVNAYVDPSVGASMSMVWEEEMRKVSQAKLSSFCERIREEGGAQSEFFPKCISQYGDLPGALRPIIKEEGVDLLIMGSSGAGSASKSLFGSVAYATMKNAACPVLTVPLQSGIKTPHRIGLATEEKLVGDERILEPLQELVDQLNAWLMGIRVSKDASIHTTSGEEEEFYEDIPDIQYFDLRAGDALVGIEQAIGEHDIDMLSIIIKKRSLLDSLFHVSVSKKIAKQVAIPLLTLHDEGEKR